MNKLAKQSGFTLIELLVVVLIIGILAAVALPQYQKAVEKSKIAQALPLLKSVGQAAQSYYLATGNIPTSFDQLEVDIPAGESINLNSGSIQNIFCGTGMVAQAISKDWGIAIVPSSNKNAIFVFRLTGDYSYLGSKPGVIGFKIKEGDEIPAGFVGCIGGGSGTTEYCEKFLKLSVTSGGCPGYYAL